MGIKEVVAIVIVSGLIGALVGIGDALIQNY